MVTRPASRAKERGQGQGRPLRPMAAVRDADTRRHTRGSWCRSRGSRRRRRRVRTPRPRRSGGARGGDRRAGRRRRSSVPISPHGPFLVHGSHHPARMTTLARMSDETLAKTASTAYDAALEVIASVEPRIAEATRQELADQRASLKLIASENYASPAVLLTMGTWFSDKYAEGTIGHRFYAGCQNVDTVESVAAEHARELFGAPYAYVQPHSGIDANLVAFWSILAHRVETPGLQRARREERQRAQRGRLGDAAPRVRQPAPARHVAGRRRPPHPRLPAEHQRQDVPPAAVRHRPRDRSCSTTTRCGRRRRSSSRWCSWPATRRTRAG